MTASIVPQPQTEREMFVNRCCNRLIQELMNMHRDRPIVSVACAAGVGVRALESGASYFEAMEAAEDALDRCDESLDIRNRERLAKWKWRKLVYNESKRVSK